MKATLHFPTQEYGFAEVEVEVETPQEAVQVYKDAIEVGNGLDHSEWNETLDFMLNENQCNPDTIQRMSEKQKWMINELKKAYKRLEQ